MARLSGAPGLVSFEYRNLTGGLISRFNLDERAAERSRLVGNTVVPDESFRIYAVGTDTLGKTFQRLVSTVIVPQSITVRPPATVDLGQGQQTNFIFEVKNDGAPNTFAFSAVDIARFLTSVTPSTATLATGQSVLVKVTLSTPLSAPISTQDTITLTAQNTIASDDRNFAVITTSVVAAKIKGDVNADRKLDCADLNLVKASFGSKAGQRSFNPDVDVDISGVIDIRDLSFVARLLPAGTQCK